MNMSSLRICPLLRSSVRRYCSQPPKDAGKQVPSPQKYSLLVPSLQASALMGGGDLLAQFLVEKKSTDQLNVKRTLQFAAMGLFVGPGLRYWYGFLDRAIKGRTPTVKAVKKVLADQLICSPIFLATFISVVGALQGENLEGIKRKLRNEHLDILITNYYIWPAAQLVNFSVVPLNYQVLFAQIVAIFWNTYLSWRTNVTAELQQQQLAKPQPAAGSAI